jgi:uncharacterized membrane protein
LSRQGYIIVYSTSTLCTTQSFVILSVCLYLLSSFDYTQLAYENNRHKHTDKITNKNGRLTYYLSVSVSDSIAMYPWESACTS